MLLAFVICSSIAVCIANPLHKFPYVFLLDIGNEELEKTNTEQLRVSIPGGSLAMKYPAMGEGDPITHVRVSGIDFGTDLKVNIVEGGPGYKYVVLMFMGNPGITYDAVVTLQTLQTLPGVTEMSFVNTNEISSTDNSIANAYKVTDPDSDNDDQSSINDPKNIKQYSKKSKEVMQSTSTFYNYAKSETADGDEDKESENVSTEEQDDKDDDDDDDSKDEEDEDNVFLKNIEQKLTIGNQPENPNDAEHEVSDEDENEGEDDDSVKDKLYNSENSENEYQFSDFPRSEQYRYNAGPDRMYEKYYNFNPHFGLGFRVYPQRFIYNKKYPVNPGYNKDDPASFDQMYNNEVAPNDSRFKDGTNNIDSDYLVAEY